MVPIRNNFLTKISDSLKSNQISNGTHPVRPNPVRTQEAYNIDQRLEACPRVQTLTYGMEVKWVLTGCRGLRQAQAALSVSRTGGAEV